MVTKLTPQGFEKIQQAYEDALQERARQVKVMRDKLGWSFEKIGEHFGISKQAAYQIYKSFNEDVLV